jgi:hypothetical protein
MAIKLTDEQKQIIGQYGKFFTDTGGNDIVELIERDGVNLSNNSVVCMLQASCYAQLVVLYRLLKEGILPKTLPEPEEWQFMPEAKKEPSYFNKPIADVNRLLERPPGMTYRKQAYIWAVKGIYTICVFWWNDKTKEWHPTPNAKDILGEGYVKTFKPLS